MGKVGFQPTLAECQVGQRTTSQVREKRAWPCPGESQVPAGSAICRRTGPARGYFDGGVSWGPTDPGPVSARPREQYRRPATQSSWKTGQKLQENATAHSYPHTRHPGQDGNTKAITTLTPLR